MFANWQEVIFYRYTAVLVVLTTKASLKRPFTEISLICISESKLLIETVAEPELKIRLPRFMADKLIV